MDTFEDSERESEWNAARSLHGRLPMTAQVDSPHRAPCMGG